MTVYSDFGEVLRVDITQLPKEVSPTGTLILLLCLH